MKPQETHPDLVKQLRDQDARVHYEFGAAFPVGATTAYADAADEIERLRAALGEIAKGEGEFSANQLEHATNCIESMKTLAREALANV